MASKNVRGWPDGDVIVLLGLGLARQVEVKREVKREVRREVKREGQLKGDYTSSTNGRSRIAPTRADAYLACGVSRYEQKKRIRRLLEDIEIKRGAEELRCSIRKARVIETADGKFHRQTCDFRRQRHHTVHQDGVPEQCCFHSTEHPCKHRRQDVFALS